MYLHEVENPLLEVVQHANLHYMEEVSLREVASSIGHMSKHGESSVDRRDESSASASLVLASLIIL
jgi:hypothetical protein